MKLIDLVNLYDNFSEEVSDNYIDIALSIDYDMNDNSFSKEYPNLYKFTKRLISLAEVEKINGDVIICKFSKIIDDNIEKFKGFIKNNWCDSMQWVLEEDVIKYGEFHYEILNDINNVLIGRYSEKVISKYLYLLNDCK